MPGQAPRSPCKPVVRGWPFRCAQESSGKIYDSLVSTGVGALHAAEEDGRAAHAAEGALHGRRRLVGHKRPELEILRDPWLGLGQRDEGPRNHMRPVDEAAVVARVETREPLVRVERADILLDELALGALRPVGPRDREAHAAAVAFRPEDLPALGVELLLRCVCRRDREVLAPRRWVPLSQLPFPHGGKPLVETAVGGRRGETVRTHAEGLLAVVIEDGRGNTPLQVACGRVGGEVLVANMAAACLAKEPLRSSVF